MEELSTQYDENQVKILYKTPPLTDEILKTLLAKNAQFYKNTDLQILHELFRMRSKKGFYIYTPVRPLFVE